MICDFHIHSKYSRATSQKMELENIAQACERKGIDVVATGDFTHPKWFKEIKEKLEERDGLLYLKNKKSDVAFILSVEVNNFYNFSGKERKVHNVLLSPSIEVAEQINELLSKYSKLEVDGRPSIAMSNAEMIERLKQISKEIEIFAAHAWTPWFGVFGSKSGFDSLKEAYEGKEKELLAIETGLSSDLEMNFCVSALDNYTLISNSDAHSLEKIGREANVIEAQKSYKEIIKAIKQKKVSTIEYYPQEGKYHYDGHRNCGVSFSPEETKKFNGICPVCRRPLTIGVLHRVFELADRSFGYIPKNAQKSIHLIPLIEIISKVTKKEIYSKEVEETYKRFTQNFKEFDVLTKVNIDELKSIDQNIGLAIKNVREGKVKIIPGYDGVYGKIEIQGFENSFKLKPKLNKQEPLF